MISRQLTQRLGALATVTRRPWGVSSAITGSSSQVMAPLQGQFFSTQSQPPKLCYEEMIKTTLKQMIDTRHAHETNASESAEGIRRESISDEDLQRSLAKLEVSGWNPCDKSGNEARLAHCFPCVLLLV